MGKFRVEVDGVDRTIRNFKRDLKRGMEKSASRLADAGKTEARNVLQMHDRIFNKDVYRKFRYVEGKSNPAGVRGKLINYSDHADAVESGVPASSYTGGGPPVQSLLPWVERKMQGWTLSFEENDGGGGGHPISFKAYDGTLVTGDTDSSWRTYNGSIVPDREEIFIGQRLVVGDKSNNELRYGEVDGIVHNQATITFDDGSSMELNVENPYADEIIIGHEDWYNRSRDTQYRDIRRHLDNLPSELSDADTEKHMDFLHENFYQRFHNIEDAKQMASALREIQEHTSGDSGVASAHLYADSTYHMNLKGNTRRSSLIHENGHGTHFTKGIKSETYADWPDQDPPAGDPVYQYPDFWFNRDGSSKTSEPDVYYHLLENSDGDKLGYDSMDEMYERADGNYNIDYRLVGSDENLLDPDDPGVGPGDVLKIQMENQPDRQFEIHDGNAIPDPRDDFGDYYFEGEFIHHGGNSEIYVNADGSIHDFRFSVVGYADSPDYYDMPISDHDDEFDELAEAVNLAWMKQVFQLSQYREAGNDRPEDDPVDAVSTLARRYSIRNPNETWAVLTETLLTGRIRLSPSQRDALRDITNDFPGLIEQFLEIWDPDESLKTELEQMGIDT